MRLAVLAACLATLPCAAQTAAPSPAKIPASVFAARDQFYAPNMSPDGKHMAVTVRVPVGKRLVPMITVYSLPDMKVEATVRMQVFEVPSSYVWASNTRLVVEKAMEVGTREAPRLTGEVIALDFDGTKQEYLYGSDMFKYSRGNRFNDDWGYGWIASTPWPMNNHVLLTTHPWQAERTILVDIDTSNNATRKERASLPVKGLSFITQNDGTVRFAYGRREDNSYLLMRTDGGDKWDTVAPAKVGTFLRPFSISKDNSEYMAWHSAKGEPASVIVEKFASGDRRVYASDPDGDMTLLYGRIKGPPIAAYTTTGKPRVVYFNDSDPDVNLHKALSAQFPDSLVRFFDFTEDGSKLIFSVRSDRDPGVIYMYDRKTNRADMLMMAMEPIDPDQMAERMSFSFKARDGLLLHGFLTLPKHAPQQKLPLVLFPHGGPTEHDEWFFDPDAQFLASRGYAVLQVNFRGSGNRGQAFQELGYRQWGGKIMDDLLDGVKWASGRNDIDPARICVMGASSFGGYSALMLAAREPEMFKCAIGYAGVYDLPYIFKEDLKRTSARSTNWYKKAIGEDKDELERFSPAAQARNIKAPVLLIHGGKDEIAPKEHAFRMRDALTAAGKAPEWMYIDYEGHGFYDTENATAVYTKLEDFLKRHIGAK
jgi:pimeloyl-ACP methyl ester carboxylesterase